VPQINLPIFDGGRISANLKIAESNQKIAINQYEKTIQTAFREVADALAVDDNIQEELRAQEALVSATQQSLNLSLVRFEQGISSYLNVLDSQRAYYSARQNYILIKLVSYVNTLTLYKALGGGL
jgi:multidrug efflux system outer membrane protein